ncbi:sigma-70 family RNA polymerase sigma factor [Aeromicrobium sp.]|uniref:RNA polymerase sigma factor n=1 Tax=Aeromicrobium sp. TaxID=1871063 RepID=UPI0030C204DF
MFFHRHRGWASRVARRYVLRDEVEDVVNEAFTAMLCQLRAGGGPRDNPLGYLAVSVRHEAIRRAKYNARRTLTDEIESLFDVVAYVECSAARVVERDSLAAAMASLSPRQREILWAVEIDGLRPRELAADLGVDANAVAARIYRARQALGHAYRRQNDTDIGPRAA